MSSATRASLAMALAWAGGFGLPGPPGVELIVLVIVIALGLVARGRMGATLDREPAPAGGGSMLARIVGPLALALLLALLARTIGRVIIEAPAALGSVLVAMITLALGLRGRGRARAVFAPALVGLALTAAVLGAGVEARGPQARGAVYSGPVIGVHPRQAVAVRVDGFGPHDIIVDDYVDPPGGQGYDPTRWAARLQDELRAVATRDYAAGPARARAAFSRAEVEVVEAIVPPAERELYDSLLGVAVRSGTRGEGSTVEFVCPGQPQDPRGARAGAWDRACPRKYLVDGSTGLGLSPRWPGYTEARGRDRVRLARLLGWPTGDARSDRRRLALESGIWLLALVLTLMLGAWGTTRGERRDEPSEAPAPAGADSPLVTAGLALTLGTLALLAVLAPIGDAALDDAPLRGSGGPTLLAILLVLLPGRRGPGRPSSLQSGALPFALVLLLALLAASPLAGHGDALELLALTRARLVELGLGWSRAEAIAGSLAGLALTLGAGICAAALLERHGDRERRHTRQLALALALALALGIGLALALRKPGDDLALLSGAAALVLLSSTRLRDLAGRRVRPDDPG